MCRDQVTAWVSDARFLNFLRACDGHHDRAVALYCWNAEISGAFLEVLHHLEVLLRNAIDHQFPATPDDELVAIWSDRTWLTDPSIVEERGRERVNEAIERLTKAARKQTRARVIASLSFGFWAALFTGRYDDLWRSRLRHAFPNGNGRRRQIHNLVQSIGDIRNRIAHHEAIFATDLNRQYAKQLELAGLIDGDARDYVAALPRVPDVLAKRPS